MVDLFINGMFTWQTRSVFGRGNGPGVHHTLLLLYLYFHFFSVVFWQTGVFKYPCESVNQIAHH